MIEGELPPLPDCERSLRIILHLAVQAQRRHDAKVAKYRAENPQHDPACGILTRETCYLAGVLPRLARAGITPQHIQDLADGRQPTITNASSEAPA